MDGEGHPDDPDEREHASCGTERRRVGDSESIEHPKISGAEREEEKEGERR